MLVTGFGRRKVKRGDAHTAPVKELAARSMVNKLSAKKIAADTYRSLREDWYGAIFTRGLVNLSIFDYRLYFLRYSLILSPIFFSPCFFLVFASVCRFGGSVVRKDSAVRVATVHSELIADGREARRPTHRES